MNHPNHDHGHHDHHHDQHSHAKAPWRPHHDWRFWVAIVLMLAGMAAWGCWKILESLRRDPEVASLRLAYLVVALIYNLTEAAFKGVHLVWIAFLLAVTVVPLCDRHYGQ